MDQDALPNKDLNISSFLLASGQVKLVKTERTPDRNTIFYFAPKIKAEELVVTYWSDTASSIQPRKLFGAQRDLKDIINRGGI